MCHKKNYILTISLILNNTCLPITIQIYNSLPCTLYYAFCNKTLKSNPHNFIKIEPYQTIQKNLKETAPIELSVTKEIPQPGEDIPFFEIIPADKASSLYLKTYQTNKGNIRILPHTDPLIKDTTNTISHHNIWVTKTTYQAPQSIPEITDPQTSSSNPISATTPITSTNTSTPEAVQPAQEETLKQPLSEANETSTITDSLPGTIPMQNKQSE